MMSYSIYLEEMEERWIAHVAELWGCYAAATDRESALAQAPQAIQQHLAWRQAHGDATLHGGPFEVRVAEMQREWIDPTDPSYSANAFFAIDVPPLTAEDLDDIRRLLDWNRADLLATVKDLPQSVLEQEVENDWSINTIVLHTGRSERWYLDRLGLAFPFAELNPDPFQRLEQSRTHLLSTLPSLVGIARIVWKDSELWSPRKMVRRALWHERDHMQHIWQFRERLGV
jgi:predicted RNase H-like HicB family nuclease